ncbi:MAG TPA: tetratricopeptide repeat protein, partial [Nitrospirae bacterium]|nr:tetratricopeptide repeat protein [Nitrospirota bacterium]
MWREYKVMTKSKPHTGRGCDQLISLFTCSVILLFIPLIISCTDPVAAKKKHFERGVSYFEKEDFKKAIIEFKNVIQIDTMHADAHFYLGKAYLKFGKTDSAIKELEKAVEIKPSLEKDSLLFLGRAYLLKGEYD